MASKINTNRNYEQFLYVTPDQYSHILKLSLDCEYLCYFDNDKWIMGLEKICGKEVIDQLDRYKPTKLVVKDWSC